MRDQMIAEYILCTVYIWTAKQMYFPNDWINARFRPDTTHNNDQDHGSYEHKPNQKTTK